MRRRAFVPGLKPTHVPPPEQEAPPMPAVPTRFMPPELDAIIDELLMIDSPGRLTEVLAKKEQGGAQAKTGEIDRLRTRAGARPRKTGSAD